MAKAVEKNSAKVIKDASVKLLTPHFNHCASDFRQNDGFQPASVMLGSSRADKLVIHSTAKHLLMFLCSFDKALLKEMTANRAMQSILIFSFTQWLI